MRKASAANNCCSTRGNTMIDVIFNAISGFVQVVLDTLSTGSFGGR